MVTLKQLVCDALSGACARVVYGRPACFRQYPLLCWRESLNRRFAQADGREYLTELNYDLDIFADSVEAAGEIAARADERMRDVGFRRDGACELYEQERQIAHVSLRYRALADANGGVWQ